MAMASSIEMKLAEYRRQKANTCQQVESGFEIYSVVDFWLWSPFEIVIQNRGQTRFTALS